MINVKVQSIATGMYVCPSSPLAYHNNDIQNYTYIFFSNTRPLHVHMVIASSVVTTTKFPLPPQWSVVGYHRSNTVRGVLQCSQWSPRYIMYSDNNQQ